MTSALIINAYSARNAGDAAISLATAELLGDLGVREVTVSTRHHSEDTAFYARHGLNVAPPLIEFPVRGAMPAALRAAVFARGLVTSTLRDFIPIDRAAANVAAGYDLVALAGGGYLYSARRRVNLTLLHELASMHIARRSGTRLVMMPQSLGPFSRPADRVLVRRVLRNLPHIVVREEISAVEAAALAPRVPRVVSPDVALYSIPRIAGEPTRALRPIVIVPMDWTWARLGASLGRYADEMGVLVRRLVEQGHEVVLSGGSAIPEQGQDDIAVAQTIARKSAARQVTVHGVGGDPDDLSDLLGAASVVIGTRLHSCLLALRTGTPAIHLAYQPKGVGTFRLLGLSDLCSDVATFRGEEVAARAHAMAQSEAQERARVTESVAAARQRILALYRGLLERPA